ncbi:hypothetical protein N7505_007685 [Penicillium chrysogenum]|uniref:AC9 transposase n=1 Tax=Penicillium chrysogenum TaxID=5076 RepID=A0ABQ8WE26_PENCH|nr:hypothetical protein N7505_007685 [Penicillium chrysogenum]
MLAINAHWMSSAFQQYRACIEFVGIEGSHSGENLANIVATVLERFHISDKVMTIIADNASNNDTLPRYLYQRLSQRYDEYLSETIIREGTMKFTHNSQICCFAHILNLVMKTILRSLRASSHKEACDLLDDVAKRSWKTANPPTSPIAKLRLILSDIKKILAPFNEYTEDWQIEVEDNDVNFDCHFFGFTQLYAPDDNEAVVADIIAIVGLDGHAYGSWQGRGNLGRMWLRDFLSKDLPQCRTMIYGYNSKLSSYGVDTILDYGRELMEEIKEIRNTKETMEENHPAITSLHRATYGMVLFAILHKGLVMDDIQQMLLADFKNLIRDRKVVSFYETEQTRRLVSDSESGRWKRTGNFVTTVSADSALLQLPDHVEDKVPLHAGHSMVVKFDTRNAAGYRTALDKLRQFSKDALSVVAARFDNADGDSVFFDSNVSDKRGPLVSFLPQAAYGSLLVTSRNGLAAGNLVGNDGHMIEVQPMNEEESLALLRARLPELQSEVSGEPRED